MPISIKALCDAMIDPSSNCSRLVDKLVFKKLAERLDPQSDKRIVLVMLTESGIKLADAAAEVVFTQFKGKFDGLTEQDLTYLNLILDKLKAVIDNGQRTLDS